MRAKTTVTGTKRIPQNPSKAGGSDVVLSVGFGAFRLAFQHNSSTMVRFPPMFRIV